MKEITHSNGSKCAVQYFGNLKEKIQFAKSYGQMWNDLAAKTHQPQVDIDYAVKKIIKAHNKFYGNSKYDGQGNLK